MRKFLNISLLLLLFGLSGSLSCENQLSPQDDVLTALDIRDTGLSEPGLYAGKLYGNRTRESSALAPVQTAPAPITSVPALVNRPGLISVSESGTSIVSRTYPWAECGVVQLDKTTPKEIGLNTPFNYLIKVSNLTNTTLTDIIITEQLPGNFRFINANPTAKEDEKMLIWEIPSLGPKANKQFSVSGTATYIEPIKSCTTVITPVIPTCSNVEVIQPELKLTKTAPDEVQLCDPIPITFVVTNSGTGFIQNVKIVDTLPAGLRTTNGKSEIIFDAGTLMAGQSRQFSTELRATQTGQYTSKAVASSTTGLRTESGATTTIVGLPILTIEKTGPEEQYIGRPLTYEITVTNKSAVPAKNTVVEDSIPDGVTSVKASTGTKLSGSKLIWEFGTLAPNESKKVRVSYIPTKAGTLLNSATANAYCTETVSSSMRTEVTGIPAVLLEVVDVEDPVRIGSHATYVIRVTNQGSAAATNIRIACILEDNVRYVSSAGATAGSKEGPTVRFFPLGSLAPQDKAAWRVVVEAVKPGDVRFKVVMTSEQLTRPVEKTEATYLYE